MTRTRAPQAYWSDIEHGQSLCAGEMTRDQVREYCNDRKNCNLGQLLTVVAWGVARTPNRNRIYLQREHVLGLMDATRRAACPIASYRLYREARVPGLGPVYWTKLIHFCEPSGAGYILDRFTAASADILMACPIGLCGRSGVSRLIDERQYETYCDFVRALADRMSALFGRSVPPEEAELAMYAGRSHPWRGFVKSLGRASGCSRVPRDGRARRRSIV